jgi:tripartite ATP-independent transporter DctP family solute receptor
MKNVFCFMAVVLLTTTVLFAGGGKTPTRDEKIVWKLPQTLSEDHPALVASRLLAEALAKETGGRWTLEVYGNATLGSELETIEMLRSGTIQIVPANITIMEMYLNDFAVFALPYLFRSYEDLDKFVMNHELCKDLWKRLEAVANLRFIGVIFNGYRTLSTTKIKPIRSPADLAGVKLRSMEAPVQQEIIRALGGTPIPVSFNELYMALQTGIVFGQDNPVALIYSQKFYEVTDDLYRNYHSANTSTYYLNPQAYDSLSPDDKALFNRLWKQYMVDEYNKLFAEYEKTAEDAIREAGVKFHEQSELDMQAFYKSADTMKDRYMADENIGKYIKAINEYFHYN